MTLIADKAESKEFKPVFNAEGLIPCVTTDKNGHVLMMAWMNREALDLTISTGEMHYWSRSRGELWRKGATSGHIQKLISLKIDCDQDCLLAEIESVEAACHTGRPTCFYRSVISKDGKITLQEG